MQFTIKRKYLDYVYWIFPVIFMGLAFFAISRDKQSRKSDLKTVTNMKADSSITISSGSVLTDTLATQLFNDDASVPMEH